MHRSALLLVLLFGCSAADTGGDPVEPVPEQGGVAGALTAGTGSDPVEPGPAPGGAAGAPALPAGGAAGAPALPAGGAAGAPALPAGGAAGAPALPAGGAAGAPTLPALNSKGVCEDTWNCSARSVGHRYGTCGVAYRVCRTPTVCVPANCPQTKVLPCTCSSAPCTYYNITTGIEPVGIEEDRDLCMMAYGINCADGVAAIEAHCY